MKRTAENHRPSAAGLFLFAPLRALRGFHLGLAFALLACFGLGRPAPLRAHDHIEVGLSPANPAQLAMLGPAYQLALHVPKGEPFSAYLPNFPGGGYPAELTFSAEGNAIEFAEGSLPRIELVSVTGPTGATFSFWEPGATAPAWTRPAGWSASETDRPSLAVYEDATGHGHVHGRAFSADQPGTYEIVFRAVDDARPARAPSADHAIAFNALPSPQLAIRLEAGQAKLSFASRAGLSYDLQVSTTLAWDDWTTIDFADGTGTALEFSDLLNNRPRVFYRLVEYR